MSTGLIYALNTGFMGIYFAYLYLPQINILGTEIEPLMLVCSVLFVIRCFEPLVTPNFLFSTVLLPAFFVDVITGSIHGQLLVNVGSLIACEMVLFCCVHYLKVHPRYYQLIFLMSAPALYCFVMTAFMQPSDWGAIWITLAANALVLPIAVWSFRKYFYQEVEEA